MIKITLYIWQLGVNIIGFPELFKFEQTQEKFILKGKGTNKDVFVFSNIIKYLGVFFGALLLIGCGSFEKKHYKSVKFFNENESLAAEFCSGKFPSQTEYIKGEPIVTIDSIFIDVPFEVDCPDGTKIKDNKKVPCNQKTITITDTLRTPDLAREKVLNDKINDCNADNVLLKKENEKLEKALKNSKTYNWVLGVLCGIFIIILIKKR